MKVSLYRLNRFFLYTPLEKNINVLNPCPILYKYRNVLNKTWRSTCTRNAKIPTNFTCRTFFKFVNCKIWNTCIFSVEDEPIHENPLNLDRKKSSFMRHARYFLIFLFEMVRNSPLSCYCSKGRFRFRLTLVHKRTKENEFVCDPRKGCSRKSIILKKYDFFSNDIERDASPLKGKNIHVRI